MHRETDTRPHPGSDDARCRRVRWSLASLGPPATLRNASGVASVSEKERMESNALLQHHHRRAPSAATPVRVVEGFDEIEGRQQFADVLALHADAASVNEADLPEAARVRFEEILMRDVADFVRTKRVEVERVGDRDFDRVVVI